MDKIKDITVFDTGTVCEAETGAHYGTYIILDKPSAPITSPGPYKMRYTWADDTGTQTSKTPDWKWTKSDGGISARFDHV